MSASAFACGHGAAAHAGRAAAFTGVDAAPVRRWPVPFADGRGEAEGPYALGRDDAPVLAELSRFAWPTTCWG